MSQAKPKNSGVARSERARLSGTAPSCRVGDTNARQE
jgi:hypothetical protein